MANDKKFYNMAEQIKSDPMTVLNDWEKEFLADLSKKCDAGDLLSINQKEKIEELFYEHVRGESVYRNMLTEIDANGEGLTGWESEFVSDILGRDQERFSQKQKNVIRRIYREKAGGNTNY